MQSIQTETIKHDPERHKQAVEYHGQFGYFHRLIRETKPRRARGRGRRDFWYVSRAEEAEALTHIWKSSTGEYRLFDASFISDIECGRRYVDRCLVECLADALEVNDGERAVMLEAAGFQGMAWLMMRLLGTEIHVQSCLEDIIASKITLAEAVEVMFLKLSTALAEVRASIQKVQTNVESTNTFCRFHLT